jgi:hypothetical protein
VRAAAAHDCLLDEDGCRASFDQGGDLERPNAEQTFAAAVEHRYYPHERPFQPFGDPAAFAERRRGKPGYRHVPHPNPTSGAQPPAPAGAAWPGREKSAGGEASSGSTGWLDLEGMSAAKIRDALQGVALSRIELEALMARETSSRHRRFVINLLTKLLENENAM